VGIVDEIKTIFKEDTIMGFGYAAVSGLASGTLGALLERYANSKWAGYFGNLVGAGIMAYVADKYLGKPQLKSYAIFGSLFPPIWEVVTDKISPEDLANKVGASLGLTWRQAATQVYTAPAQPVTLAVETKPAEVQPIEEEYLY